jgi:hypothetical protein
MPVEDDRQAADDDVAHARRVEGLEDRPEEHPSSIRGDPRGIGIGDGTVGARGWRPDLLNL